MTSILTGRTMHTREQPFRRSFTHRIAMIEVDVDKLAQASTGLFAVDKAAAISFRQKDHGARDGVTPLRLWAEARLAEAGVSLDGGRILLATFPRVLGYGFAPISVWLGHGPDGALRGVIYEVHNTFGETHAYVTAVGSGDRPTAPKDFFVSPFFDVSGSYRFTLRNKPEKLDLIVENIDAAGRSHVASMLVRRERLTDARIARWLVALPFSGLGVTAAIHWEALILWIKGARYRVKPAQKAARTTIASAGGTAGAAERPRKRA